MEDRKILERVAESAGAEKPMALATVVRVKGSTPRDVGSKMLIGADGEQVGTIGGGCGEAVVLETARAVIETGRPELVRVDLTDDVQSFSPAVCGGVMEIFIERIDAASGAGRA